MYTGGFTSSAPHGHGKYLWANGCMYEGDWLRGNPPGRGGSPGYRWAADRKQGFGSKSYANDDYYEGMWHCNLQGVMGVANGETPTSTWVSGAVVSSMAMTPSSGPTATAVSFAFVLSKSQGKEQEKQVFWALAPLTSMSWSNVGDDDNDDYYATTVPPEAIWGVSEQQHVKKVEETIEEVCEHIALRCVG
ncbi:hypothetical protein ZIOFF_073031 [Zingiber officinale]|uniref:Uncharacterized protein n=1 Tax=Zingiber officinale TaxID=94328 RepID=A0A8J5C6H7_ZINOF|nr:hypothetical protein ZIOFF_073031 [Zingiber officinale]